MAASHPIAGDDIEHGNDEKAEAGGDKNGVKHFDPSAAASRPPIECVHGK